MLGWSLHRWHGQYFWWFSYGFKSSKQANRLIVNQIEFRIKEFITSKKPITFKINPLITTRFPEDIIIILEKDHRQYLFLVHIVVNIWKKVYSVL